MFSLLIKLVQMAESRAITISKIGVKARSKKEVYVVLTVEGGLYLSPIEDASQVYLKQIQWKEEVHSLQKSESFKSSSCEEVESELHIIICIKLC